MCAELPCDPHEELWALSDDELGAKLCEWLAGVGLPVTAKVRRTETRRLGYAYPVYDRDFESHLKVLDRWAERCAADCSRSAARAFSPMTTRITRWPWRTAQWIA